VGFIRPGLKQLLYIIHKCLIIEHNLIWGLFLKDRLQEVPKSDNWPRRHFFPGDLRDISALRQYKKGYKPPFPT
jgi:hypothetical protein